MLFIDFSVTDRKCHQVFVPSSFVLHNIKFFLINEVLTLVTNSEV